MGNLPHCSVLLCILFICQIHFGDATACIDGERRALVEFRNGLVDNANRLSSWIGNDCCNWDGITCNSHTGHVEKLDLHNPSDGGATATVNGTLGGEISSSLLNLELLQYLDLSFNDFSGAQIPVLIGSLKNMRYLNLSNAGFGGEIPRHLGNLSNLQYLDLSLTSYGLTAKNLMWITRLASLKSLDLSGVDLNECQDWLDSANMLPSLTSLKLRGCGLAGAISPPLSLVNLTSLVSLDFGSNNFNSSFPLWLFNLSNLAVLRLANSYLEGPIPSMSGKFSSLTVLDLSQNSFNSSLVPESLCNQTSLIYMDLSWNQLEGSLPLCLGNLTSLEVLNLTQNIFAGKLPSELGNLKFLTTLDLSFNYFQSSIPSSFGQLKKLEVFYLSDNRFKGTVLDSQLQESLPLCIGNLTSLRVLNLTNNYFRGEIPVELGYLKQLSHLDLSINFFKGSIPPSFGQLSNLNFLHLHHNQLNGTIPITLGQLTELQEFDISFNSLIGELSESHFLRHKSLNLLSVSGNHFLTFNVSSQWIPPFQLQELYADSILIGSQVPAWLQTQKNLTKLSISDASISGTIPKWLGTLGVKDLFLSGNKINGSLISFAPDTHILDLSNNFLTGPIVLFDVNYTNNLSLAVLKLDINNFTGTIPNYLCNLSSLVILSLANNQLTGGIPLCFGNFTKLNVLDLSNNSLSGQIPSTLGNVETLMFLHLNRNNFHGVLPSSLNKLIFLLTLDLGENGLTGTIPEWIGNNFKSLRFLTLQSNKFHGNISLHLCELSLLQVLNLAENKLVGRIPPCLGNLSMMASDELGSYYTFDTYIEGLSNIVKGIELHYSSNLHYVKSLSLSGNIIDGEIPEELMALEGLQSLNLSNNNLNGEIPKMIGNLKHLESLDLAKNKLSGPIPQSLATIDALSYLNLSFNNLVGRIPTGNHFDTLNNPSIYEGNIGLCGKPLSKNCSDGTPSTQEGSEYDQKSDDEFEFLWFYAGIAPGFSVGLLGFFCILYFKKSWRNVYFDFVDNISYSAWSSRTANQPVNIS